MSDIINATEKLSIKERTKSKFELLLKAALDDAKRDRASIIGSSYPKSNKIIRKDGTKEGTQSKTDNDSELRKLYVKSIGKRDKEGLINEGFNKDGLHLENQHLKNHDLLSVMKHGSTTKKSSDVIELESYECLEPDANEISNESTLETNNLVDSSDAGHFDGLQLLRKIPKKKTRGDEDAQHINAQERESNFTEEHLLKQQKTGVKRKKHKAKKSNASVLQSSAADEGALAEVMVISPDKESERKHTEESTTHVAVADVVGSNNMPNKQILSVKIHRVDRLKMNIIIKHPLVRAHIVDGSNGAYIKKRNIISGDPQDSQLCPEYILPTMTFPCKLKEKKSVLPVWEEVLHFNESLEYLTQEINTAMLFFEVLDFLPMSAASSQHSKRGTESGWYHIAWAFLKIVGANNKLNAGRRMQLQLYFPPKHVVRPEPRVLEVFHWWASCPRVPYPATLYITVSAVDPPTVLQPLSQSSIKANAGSCGSGPSSRSPADEVHNRRDRIDSSTKPIQQWSRLPGQSCKVPNKHCLSLKTASMGCMAAAFSHNGVWIACGCHDNDAMPILIYEIPSGKLFKKLLGPSSLIYDVQFSNSDDCLLSASADGTASVWPVQSSKCESVVVLPHPSYVYTAQFHPLVSTIVVTGCYDTVIRIWDIASETLSQKQLVKELEGHNAYINSICFNGDGTKMYSGDSKGIIHIWTVSIVKEHSEGVSGHWDLYKTVCNTELMEISISKLICHPNLCRLIVQSQDGIIRMLDEKNLQIIQRYRGYLNLSDYMRCCITPCGNFIFTGSEDHCVYAWNTLAGVQAAIYSDLPHCQTIHCTIFHPHDNYVAFCSFGSNLPVLIYKFDPNFVQLEVGRVQPQQAIQEGVPLKAHDSSLRSRNLSFEETRQMMVSDSPATSSTNCLKTIMKKLDSVLDISSNTNMSFQESNSQDPNATNMSWGSTFHTLGINPNAPILKKAVAQFEYNPERSDELPFRKGDIVNILDIESDQWWIGRLADGRHGYVPAKFFVRDGLGRGSISPNCSNESLNVEEKTRNVTALLKKDGELTFISDSDDENPVASSTPINYQRRRRKKQSSDDGDSHC